jgi:hypothetical protein
MVFFILLGLMDVVFAGMMLGTHLGWLHLSWRFAAMGAAYWIGKGVFLRGSFLSILDIAAGIYFILVMLGVRTWLVYVFLIIMIYKFVTSLILRG